MVKTFAKQSDENVYKSSLFCVQSFPLFCLTLLKVFHLKIQSEELQVKAVEFNSVAFNGERVGRDLLLNQWYISENAILTSMLLRSTIYSTHFLYHNYYHLFTIRFLFNLMLTLNLSSIFIITIVVIN
jgi:hypothetical protein